MEYDFSADCGWCGTTKAGFTVNSNHALVIDEFGVHFVIARCRVCSKGVLAIFGTVKNIAAGVGLANGIETLRQRPLREMLPRPRSTAAPKYTPPSCERAYRQAMTNLATSNSDAAGAMFRKALEVGLKDRFSLTKRNLADRIQEAATKGLLTKDMADWATQIRLGGNDAVHNEDYTQEEAEDLKVFTELVLRYLFELPGNLKEAREKADERKKEKNNVN